MTLEPAKPHEPSAEERPVVERPSSGVQRRLDASRFDAGAGLPDVGSVVDGIEVTACVGAGALGSFLCGRPEGQPEADASVLLAFPSPALAGDATRLDALRLESFAAARLRHPNVVAVEGLRYWNGKPYIRAEHVRGVTMARLLRALRERGLRLAPFAVVGLGLRVARGLHALHRGVDPEGAALGLVHHGITPLDVVIGLDGSLKLAALSMRRLRPTSSEATAARMRWLSPEELSGFPADARADVHAVGMALLELAIGRRVLDAQSAEEVALLARCQQRPRLAAHVPGAPEALDRVLAAATSLDAGERPNGAAELAHVLAAALPEGQELGDAVFARLVRALMHDDASELAHLRAVGLLL